MGNFLLDCLFSFIETSLPTLLNELKLVVRKQKNIAPQYFFSGLRLFFSYSPSHWRIGVVSRWSVQIINSFEAFNCVVIEAYYRCEGSPHAMEKKFLFIFMMLNECCIQSVYHIRSYFIYIWKWVSFEVLVDV